MGKYKDLENQRVVITGGASGIGLATAQRFSEEGARVVIFDWNKEQLEGALSDNPSFSGGVHMDVSQAKEVEDAFQKTDDIMEGIDILVANAGISFRSFFLDLDYEQWSRVIRVNLDGAFLCAKEAIKRMRQQEKGVVLFTASTNGLEGHPFYSDYNASKAGVVVLAKTLALEFAPWLRVNAVCPGYVLTPMQKAEYSEEKLEEMNADIPLQRQALPEEVAALFAFLASDDSAFITGQAIPIDGGETAGLFHKDL
jgi:NAD(P)-dependent dehydrogenase (short-subunit alcohol dehydrogenase family)